VVAERAASEPAASVPVPPAEASAAPAPSLPEAPVAIPLPVFFAPLSAADVAELATWLRHHGRGALADASSHAGPLARRAGAAAHRAGSAALGALDSAGRGVATCVPCCSSCTCGNVLAALTLALVLLLAEAPSPCSAAPRRTSSASSWSSCAAA
jgi:hypothetical protein